MTKENHIILKIEAVIIRRKPSKLNPHPISLSISGKAYPRISSGSRFGYAGSFNTVEEAERALKEYLDDQAEWFRESYFRPVKIKLTVKNEVENGDSSIQKS